MLTVPPAKIYQAVVFLEPNDGSILKCDTIEHDGHFWLVPQWLEALDRTHKMPSHMIQLTPLPHQAHIGSPIGDFSVAAPIPIAVFEGRGTAPGFVVEILPAMPGTNRKPH